ncbi:MAG: hypothetical protein AAF206_06655, partial [Bacteroidota bacterium]
AGNQPLKIILKITYFLRQASSETMNFVQFGVKYLQQGEGSESFCYGIVHKDVKVIMCLPGRNQKY